jgi:hypothetical protein
MLKLDYGADEEASSIFACRIARKDQRHALISLKETNRTRDPMHGQTMK